MRSSTIALLFIAAATLSRDSSAAPDAGAARVVIPPRVEEATLPAFDAEPFPEEKSQAPTPSEWKDVPRVRLSRVADGVTGCNAYRVREWIQIHCDRQTAGARLIAGSPSGIALWVPEPLSKDNAFSTMGRFVEIVFPVRRGDRRVFETLDFDFGMYEGWGTAMGFFVEERWPEGAKSPEIALLSP
jgi:hypothetical protein